MYVFFLSWKLSCCWKCRKRKSVSFLAFLKLRMWHHEAGNFSKCPSLGFGNLQKIFSCLGSWRHYRARPMFAFLRECLVCDLCMKTCMNNIVILVWVLPSQKMSSPFSLNQRRLFPGLGQESCRPRCGPETMLLPPSRRACNGKLRQQTACGRQRFWPAEIF